MKLKKAILLKETRPQLVKLGYTEVKDSLTGAHGLFIKVLEDGFYLTLGLEMSSFYDTRFTASFYLSKTTRWASSWGDIPYSSYERIGVFLTKEERLLYLDEEHNKEGVRDAWWLADRKGDYDKFIQVVKITEPRFLAQKDLFFSIENSKEVEILSGYAKSVFRLIADGIDDDEYKYYYLPKNNVDDIPEQWFKAAEITLRQCGGIVNTNTVKKLAGDAWRQWSLLSRP